jgi:hypothetical protein
VLLQNAYMRECSIVILNFVATIFFNDRTSNESCARQKKSYQGEGGQWGAGKKFLMFKSVEPFKK